MALALVVPLAATGCSTADAAPTTTVVTDALAARPGADHGHERLFPDLGNGGYEARTYAVHFDYRPGTSRMPARTVVNARATQSLSRLSLDSAAQEVTAVTVDGRPAAFRVDARHEKLYVTPEHPLPTGSLFRVDVRYTADRAKNPTSPAYHLPDGVKWPFKSWVATKDGFAFMGQPDRAHLFFPSNDVPDDKARVSFDVTVPRGTVAVANGDLVRHRRLPDSRDEFTYLTREDIPTDVTQVAVGDLRPIDQRGPHGLPVRNWVPAGMYAGLAPAARRTAGQISWLEKTLGLRYPFERYGVLAVDSDYGGVALETATLSTFSARGLGLPAEQGTPTMVHELTHQFFGDAVSVRTWDDMWLSEGHANYYQLLYAASHGGDRLDAAMHDEYQVDADQRTSAGPPGRLKQPTSVLFDTDVPGALMLYGLRQKVGDTTFHQIERTFFDTYEGRSADTQDYIDVANRVSGRDLTSYIRSWIYGRATPPMPGHQDWKPGKPS
ncbi:zinc metalloprotease [Streptomyces sp. TS71-3]|nr:zinc metalloprotease [Streptomyces sp. TS71-3]